MNGDIVTDSLFRHSKNRRNRIRQIVSFNYTFIWYVHLCVEVDLSLTTKANFVYYQELNCAFTNVFGAMLMISLLLFTLNTTDAESIDSTVLEKHPFSLEITVNKGEVNA